MAAGKQELPKAELVSGLKEAVDALGVEVDPYRFIVPREDNLAGPIKIEEGDHAILWEAPKLSELFRGDANPPDLTRYPDEYVPYFYFIEKNVFLWSQDRLAPSDQELESFYSNLARRPDGKRTDPLQELLWRVSALLLGCYPLSEAQYAGIVRRLAHSCGNFAMKPISRNYFAYLDERIRSGG
jgi:hypothetical protein